MSRKLQSLIVMVVMGVASLGIGCYLSFFSGKGYAKTSGTIVRIEETYLGPSATDDTAEYQYDVYVSYTVEGTEYTSLFDYYEDGYEEGKQVTVLYDPADPTQITSESKGIGIYAMVVGVVLLVAAVVTFLRG